MTATRQPYSAALDMDAAEFRELGHRLVEQIADFYAGIRERDVTAGGDPDAVRNLVGTGPLPENGTPAGDLLQSVAPLIFDHSLHNGHPKFLGYVSASGAPLGALADLLAGAVNANLAKWELAPVATEIEAQTIRWLAELIGFPPAGGGIMVSGGNAANIHAFLAARQAAATWNLRKDGVGRGQPLLTAYVSQETHTWVEKAADIAGLGTDAVRWIECDQRGRLRVDLLRDTIERDRRSGHLPFLVVGTAGTVATGAIDPLTEMARLCRRLGIWFHVDGAYGAPAACLPEAPADLAALADADSVALDPHKWLYCPIEAACVMTRDPEALRAAFDFRPSYYHFGGAGESGIDYYRHGMQNTRGFRALKVWLALRSAGRDGYRRAIREDIELARHLYRTADGRPDFEARSLNLSIATFRYRPPGTENDPAYLNELNRTVLATVQKSGEAFVSNAVVDGDYLLRACVVNFRTTADDIEAVLDAIAETGRDVHARLRPVSRAAG